MIQSAHTNFHFNVSEQQTMDFSYNLDVKILSGFLWFFSFMDTIYYI